MYKLYIVYESGKRYIIPFDILEKHIKEDTISKIKADILKEIKKL